MADKNAAQGDQSDDQNKDEPKGTKFKIGDEEVEEKTLSSAYSLFKALQDPETGREIIETLARKSGLLDEVKPKDKEDVKDKLEGKITKYLKAKLGKDFEKFSDSVGPVMDQAIKEYLDEHSSKFESASTGRTWESNVDKFMEEHTLTTEVEDVMKELISDSPPNLKKQGFDAQKYLARMYKNAIEELGIEEPKSKKSGKSKSSHSEDDETPDFVVRPMPKNVSLDDAVEAAAKGIRFSRT